MKLRTIGRHIKESFKSLFRNGWMSVAAVSAVAVTLLLVGSFIAMLMNVNKLASDVENDVSVRVYIDLAASEDEQKQLGEQLEKLDKVDSVEYRTREQELKQVVGTYGDEFNLFKGDDNPLHNVYIVNTTQPEFTKKVAAEAEKMEFVSQANYGGAEADALFDTMKTVRNVGGIIIITLILTAVFLISNTIRITIFSRRTEIEIMKLVGATNWFIRWPFVIEGALIGLIGAAIPVAILSIVYVYGFDAISNYFVGTYFSLLTPSPFLYQLGGLMLGIGVVIGAIGSLLSIRRFLKI
ncbi:permease-like cell division protein FtsX [Pisciglobus halotolerans]|uniref:Cell division protein FtsX n=1 Tax=Pisciglobus halotolerans TaxID=745365 RepID=A0A1I3BKD5_9LACT|nr:permease-like cell division protein FtsX [Pisciglobus halotolerans]SFH62755.1 cell division protein FtsX [Pisciglobus halotolerans]